MTFRIFLFIYASFFREMLADNIPCTVDSVRLERHVQNLIDEKTSSRDNDMEALKERLYETERHLQEQDMKIKALSENNKEKISASKRFVMNVGSPVGFMACVSPPNLLNLTDKHTIIFDREITNTGGAYLNQTGVFTAPVKGLYAFHLSAMSLPGRQQYLAFVKDGVVISYLYPDALGSTVSVETAGNQWVVELNQGSEVWIETSIAGEIHGNCYTVFSGFLIGEID